MALQDAGLNAFNDFCRAVAFVYSDAIFENSGPSRCPACTSRAVRTALGPRRRQRAFLGKSANFSCQQAVTHDRLQRVRDESVGRGCRCHRLQAADMRRTILPGLPFAAAEKRPRLVETQAEFTSLSAV
jgi:hypothetical protein